MITTHMHIYIMLFFSLSRSSVDHSRICLQLGANDYINASLITVEEAQRNYILTQVSIEVFQNIKLPYTVFYLLFVGHQIVLIPTPVLEMPVMLQTRNASLTAGPIAIIFPKQPNYFALSGCKIAMNGTNPGLMQCMPVLIQVSSQ